MPDPDDNERNNDPKPRIGRVRHDAGGRAIWEWAIESGKYAVDSTSQLLKKLELTGITLMSDDAKPWQQQKPPQAQAEGQQPGRDAGPGHPTDARREPAGESSALVDTGKNRREQGFNPYDRHLPVGRGAPQPKKPMPPPKPRITQPPPRKRGLLARLFDRLTGR